MNRYIASVLVGFLLCFSDGQVGMAQPAGLKSNPDRSGTTIVDVEFIFSEAPFAQCHASTIVESRKGLVVAWFGGKHEKHPSVGIWLSRLISGKWTQPVEVANGNQTQGDVKRYPCWNPVLFQPSQGPLLLFYKVGPDPKRWWGEMKTSDDGGKTWSTSRKLPDGFVGPVKNKPLELDQGVLLCGSSSEDDGWQIHFEVMAGNGKQWWKTPGIRSADKLQLIQPSLVHKERTIVALCRSQHERIAQVRSTDNGLTWSEPTLTDLPNPNSGFDAVTLEDGRSVLIYNHSTNGRSPLNMAVSKDLDIWTPGQILEDNPGEFSYPAVIQSSDRMLHVTYTWKRQRIKHVVIDPNQL